MNEKVKDYIMIKGKEDLGMIFKEWNEKSLEDLEIFAIEVANLDLNKDDEKVYEFIDHLTFKKNKVNVLKELFSSDDRTKVDLIELFNHCENINNLLKMELEYHTFGTILDNEIIIELKDEKYLIENNILKVKNYSNL